MKQIRILLADNDPASLQTGSEALERAGYRVIQANNPAEARQIMETTYIHLAILDLRLSNDSDESDRSGLRLAKQTTRALPKLIWTKFPTYQDVREALKPDSHDLPSVVDFIDKRLGIEELQDVVEETLAKYLDINWDLSIQQTGPQTFSQMLNLVAPEVKGDGLSDRLTEFEDLFRTLFSASSQIALGQILAYPENRVILPVFAYDKKGIEHQFVVSVGEQAAIELENERFQTAVPDHTQQKINRLDHSAQTNHFAALSFGYSGGHLEDVEPLSVYAARHTIVETVAVVRHLFEDNLRVWYGNGRSQSNQSDFHLFLQQWLDLQAVLKSEEGMEKTIAGISASAFARGLPRIDCQPGQLTFHWAEADPTTVLNPTPAWKQLASVDDNKALWGMIHGRVTADTVLVDIDQTAWMIDFSKARYAPILCDFVLLETAVKQTILNTSTLYERYQLEERLLSITKLDDTCPQDDLSPPVQTALQIIVEIRRLASRLAGCTLKSYQIGLAYCSLAQYTAYDPTLYYTRRAILPFVYALLVAAINMAHLLDGTQTARPTQAMHSLWLDETNKTIWVEGRQIALSVQEFTILAYLYANAGRLCERQEIVEKALGETYDRLDPEQSRLNSAISRLRQKIEPDSKNPKYFLTVRGRGYKLDFQ